MILGAVFQPGEELSRAASADSSRTGSATHFAAAIESTVIVFVLASTVPVIRTF
jgi:hypothetical protein